MNLSRSYFTTNQSIFLLGIKSRDSKYSLLPLGTNMEKNTKSRSKE
jgi:hypothetical protein